MYTRGLFLPTYHGVSLIPYSQAKRSEPYCRIHTIHTSTECAAMRIPQFDSFHTAHSRMRFVSHWKRYSVLLWVALFCLTPFPVPFSSSSSPHRHKLGPGSDGARAAQSLTPPAPCSRGRLSQETDPDRHARTMYAAKCLVTNRNTN